MTQEKIDQIIDKFDAKPRALIMILMDIQHHNRWLPKEALERVSERLGVPLAKVQQIAAFYKTFSLVPKGDHELHVCTGTSCHLRGAQKVLDTVYEVAGIRPGETDSESKFSLTAVNCMGACSLGPVMMVDGQYHGRLAPSKTEDVLKSVK
ncbi:MAG: NAD(P)H-dependent oxidoreductase subunit E [Deltaproteobacteria bacterium]|nr:MAG: NAD(P)H-dependent oxidoreductase subunit E [Deltaproteobacteria bacterium]